jgi:hypothetical protein
MGYFLIFLPVCLAVQVPKRGTREVTDSAPISKRQVKQNNQTMGMVLMEKHDIKKQEKSTEEIIQKEKEKEMRKRNENNRENNSRPACVVRRPPLRLGLP